jgi:hypothetical protein
MITLGVIILILVLLFFWTRSEGFEVWPIKTPEQLGKPTPPSIMQIAEHPSSVQSDESVAEGSAEYTYNPEKGQYSLQDDYYSQYQQYSPYAPYAQYSPYSPYAQYPPYSPYPQYQPGFFPGGNTSGSASIGGFGPTPRAQITPAMVAGQIAAGSFASAQQSITPAMVAPEPSAPVAQPQQVQTVQAEPSIARASLGGRETRAKTLADEADIAGFDWGSAAAQSARAFEPTEVIETPSPEMVFEPVNPFETVAAENVAARTTIGPNVTKTTAAPAMSREQSAVLAEQKLMQASFGSVDIGNPLSAKSVSTPAGTIAGTITGPIASTIAAVRGSRNQPGSGLHDSKSTRPVIDSTTMVVPQTITPVTDGIAQSVQQIGNAQGQLTQAATVQAVAGSTAISA